MVISALQRIDGELRDLSDKIDRQNSMNAQDISELRVEVGMLKAKTMIFGVLASTAISIIVSISIPFLRVLH